MTIRQIQCLLMYLGYGTQPDGILGPKTQEAENTFQKEFQGTEGLEKNLLSALEQGWERPQRDIWEDIRYFKRNEPFIGCSCGKCGGFPVEPDKRLLALADQVREHFGVPLIPTSTVRCRVHNAAAGGVANSRHLLGKAMDFKVQGRTSAEILSYVKAQPAVRYAYAVNSRVVHMDIT